MNKPAGPSSAQCLRIFKKLGWKKVGHAGTLDPMASGVLLVLLGQATKLSSWLLAGGEKIYSGEIRLGVETDTWDMTGTITRVTENPAIDATAVAAEIAAWRGEREQLVPPYSAAKHNGEPLYALARAGKDTPVKKKIVKIYKADMLSFDASVARFRVACGSGAYIRSLAHSLGTRLGCGAALASLVREYSHPFGLDRAASLEEIRACPEIVERMLAPLTEALPDWPAVELDPGRARDVRDGKIVPAPGATAERAFLCEKGVPLALACLQDGRWRVIRGLWH